MDIEDIEMALPIWSKPGCGESVMEFSTSIPKGWRCFKILIQEFWARVARTEQETGCKSMNWGLAHYGRHGGICPL